MSPFFSFLALVTLALASPSPAVTSPAAAVAGNASSTAAQPRALSFQQQFLEAHNKARAAAGVPPLAWNATLQLDSMRYVNELRRRCDARPLYAWGTDGVYGRNIFKGDGIRGREAAPALAVASWVGERRWYRRRDNTCQAPEGRSCGEYTQVVWRGTTQVGCARRYCRGSFDALVAVCEYYPPGNVEGQHPY
ncbi:unnamed protein product [Urochloa humidicola]